MAQCNPCRCRLLVNATLVAVVLLLLALPATQNALAFALEESTEITKRLLHIPCALLDHDKCFSLDRLDPTCPQCF
jgi:hypothetical protein